MRYRDFIDRLQSASKEDEAARIIKSREIGTSREAWLSLAPGKEGGIAIVTTVRGSRPWKSGVTFRLDPTTTCAALAAALSTCEMMAVARSLLTPGKPIPPDAIDFADGLSDLETLPYLRDDSSVPVTKPPSLHADIWERIPHAQSREYCKAMARGIVRGVHPDDTVAELLAAA